MLYENKLVGALLKKGQHVALWWVCAQQSGGILGGPVHVELLCSW